MLLGRKSNVERDTVHRFEVGAPRDSGEAQEGSGKNVAMSR